MLLLGTLRSRRAHATTRWSVHALPNPLTAKACARKFVASLLQLAMSIGDAGGAADVGRRATCSWQRLERLLCGRDDA
jgi:hypothetical protein